VDEAQSARLYGGNLNPRGILRDDAGENLPTLDEPAFANPDIDVFVSPDQRE
jgi:hypothetical protein